MYVFNSTESKFDSSTHATVYHEWHGMERGRTGVTYKQAHFFPVYNHGATWVWRCGAKAPRTHQRCKAMLYTTPPPELRVTNYTQHHLAMCPALPWPPTTAADDQPSPVSPSPPPLPFTVTPTSIPAIPAVSRPANTSTSMNFASPAVTKMGKKAIRIYYLFISQPVIAGLPPLDLKHGKNRNKFS